MKTVDDRVREHYDAKKLDSERVQRLLAQARAEAGQRFQRSWVPGLAIAAGILLTLAIGLNGIGPRIQAHRLTKSAAQEIAANHIRGLESEVFAQDYGELGGQLDRLEFSLTPVPESIRDRYGLVGGRYCSILKVPAAQLALRDPQSGALLSLYVAPLDPSLESLNEGITEIDGIEVQIIKHAGRVFALAAPPAEKAAAT